MSDSSSKTESYPYYGHDGGLVITQPEAGKFVERPMTAAELAAREPARKIAADIYRHANYAGVCYYEIWQTIAAAFERTAVETTGVYTCKHGTIHSCSACHWEAAYPEKAQGEPQTCGCLKACEPEKLQPGEICVNTLRQGESPIAVNLPFERIPRHAWDPGFGPAPPMPKECEHGVSTRFRCPDCRDIPADAVRSETPVEPFVVKHYASDERPCIKGNGFDGLEIGEDRGEAQTFVDWINARLAPKAEGCKCGSITCGECRAGVLARNGEAGTP